MGFTVDKATGTCLPSKASDLPWQCYSTGGAYIVILIVGQVDEIWEPCNEGTLFRISGGHWKQVFLLSFLSDFIVIPWTTERVTKQAHVRILTLIKRICIYVCWLHSKLRFCVPNVSLYSLLQVFRRIMSAPLIYRYSPNRLHGLTSLKTSNFIVTAARTFKTLAKKCPRIP